MQSRENNPNHLRNQSVRSKGEAPSSARMLPQAPGKDVGRGTPTPKMIKGR